MVQLWNGRGADRGSFSNGNGIDNKVVLDDSLQLKVRCRMSMSLLYDSVWRWREDYQLPGRGSIEAAMKNPTNPDSAAESSASSTHMDSTLMPTSHQLGNQLMSASGQSRSLTPNHGLPSSAMMSGLGYESNYEVFDPLNWMLDGLVDFPYSYNAVSGLEANALG